MKKESLKSLFVFFLIVFAIQLSGYIATNISTDNWYANLKKPDWTGSEWTFGYVWTVLYIMIAISGWLVWSKIDDGLQNSAMKIYAAQLFCNAIWPWLFFAMHHTLFSFIDIAALLILIMFNMAYFWRYSPLSSLLLFPYLIWISYAVSINFVVALYDLLGVNR